MASVGKNVTTKNIRNDRTKEFNKNTSCDVTGLDLGVTYVVQEKGRRVCIDAYVYNCTITNYGMIPYNMVPRSQPVRKEIILFFTAEIG
jgi:hypothetical protein